MANSDAPLRVLVADDHLVVRRGIVALLGSLPGVEVVGEASSGDQAVREAALLRPDVVIMDVQMPDLDGVEATRRIVRHSPGTAVLVLTMFEDDETVLAAVRAGAMGFLLKGASQDDILVALRSVAAGQLVVAAGVAQRLVSHLGAMQPAAEAFPDLTPREREIVDRLAAGERNSDIAAGLGIALKTVTNNVSSIFTKLGVATRGEAIVRARDQGLGRAGR